MFSDALESTVGGALQDRKQPLAHVCEHLITVPTVRRRKLGPGRCLHLLRGTTPRGGGHHGQPIATGIFVVVARRCWIRGARRIRRCRRRGQPSTKVAFHLPFLLRCEGVIAAIVRVADRHPPGWGSPAALGILAAASIIPRGRSFVVMNKRRTRRSHEPLGVVSVASARHKQ